MSAEKSKESVAEDAVHKVKCDGWADYQDLFEQVLLKGGELDKASEKNGNTILLPGLTDLSLNPTGPIWPHEQTAQAAPRL